MNQGAPEGREPESWEDLEALSINDAHAAAASAAAAAAQTSDGPADAGIAVAAAEAESGEDGPDAPGDGLVKEEDGAVSSEAGMQPGVQPGAPDVDKAIQEALCNPRERATVLRVDVEVEKFVRDTSRTVLEFGPELTSYQRLLAHRVAQHYQLQTTSISVGKGMSRVVARRTPETKVPEVRVTNLKDYYLPPEMVNPKATPEITIKRRQGAAMGRALPPNANGSGNSSQGIRSVKQREEEYKLARDRILGNDGDSQSETNTSESAQGSGRTMEDLRSRKAVFRNKEVEMQDPDYKRGTNRYARSMFDPNYQQHYEQQRAGIYNVPTYSSEFPALPGAQGGGQVPPNAHQSYYPQGMPGWGVPPSMGPRSHPGPTRPQQNFQPLGNPNSSVPQSPGQPPAYPLPYPMHHYSYSPEMGPNQQQNFHQSVNTSASGYRGMPQWNPRQMGNYRMGPPGPGQESMGGPYPMQGMYGGYPSQGPGYHMDYGDMSRQQYQMHSMNGYAGGGGHFANQEAGGVGQSRQGEQPGGLGSKHKASTKPQSVEN